MKNNWKIDDSVMILTRSYLSGWVYTLIGILGVIFFIIGIIGIPAELHDRSRDTLFSLDTFTTTLLIFQFLFTLGLGMMSVLFSSRSQRNYQETISFDSSRETITIASPKTGDDPFVLHYADLANLLLTMRHGGPEDPDMYNVYAVKNDGAAIWITGFSKDGTRAAEFLETLRVHTGFAVRDESGLGLDRDAAKRYTGSTDTQKSCMSHFVTHTSAAHGEYFTLRRPRLSIPRLFLGIILYGFFFSVPFYILNNFIYAPIPVVVHFFGWVFITLWTGILLGTIFLSMKEYTIIAGGDGLTVEVHSRMLPLIRGSIHVPAGVVRGIRTNRIEDGVCSLTLVVDGSFVEARKGMATLMNLSVHKKGPGALRIEEGKRELDLWVLPARTGNTIGPGFCDLMYIGDRLKDILSIK